MGSRAARGSLQSVGSLNPEADLQRLPSIADEAQTAAIGPEADARVQPE